MQFTDWRFQPQHPIVGMANYPEVNKFSITLECGHKVLYDHSVDSISEYSPGDHLICYECYPEK